jgi:hypothetical protein
MLEISYIIEDILKPRNIRNRYPVGEPVFCLHLLNERGTISEKRSKDNGTWIVHGRVLFISTENNF